MGIKDRLSKLKAQAGAGARSPATKPSLSTLRARIAQLEKRRPEKPGSTLAGVPEKPSGINGPWPRLDDSSIAPEDGAAATGDLTKAIEGEFVFVNAFRFVVNWVRLL
jgi:hypothetical protein